MKRLICRWKGHAPDQFCEGCERCGEFISYYELVRTPWREELRRWFNWKLDWFRPCRECGKRFRRHDDSIDHIPF